ncbi:MAG: glycosyltransferase, partial [Candidatus Hodarchaeota archaeon]
TDRMNICYVSNIDISLPDGPGVNEREFVRTLAAGSELRGDEVFFIMPHPSKRLDFSIRNVRHFQATSINKPSFLWFDILSVTWHSSKLILKKIRNSNIDLFVVRLSINSILVPVLLILLGQRYSIKTLEDIYIFPPLEFNLKWKAFMLILRKILGIGLRKAVSIDVCTPQLYYNYKDKYDLKNIKIIENPVNIELFTIMDKEYCKNKCGLKGFEKIVGYCGGSPSQRGARQLVDISRDLISRYPDCGIVIIGDDAELHVLKERAKQIGTDSHMVFKGTIDYEDLGFYINCMDVGVALDTEEKIRFVGNASQKIRQYLACGVPVICPEGTNKRIVDEGLGVAVSVNELDQIYEAICFWFDKPVNDRGGVSIKSCEFAQNNFSTKKVFEERYSLWKGSIAKTVLG